MTDKIVYNNHGVTIEETTDGKINIVIRGALVENLYIQSTQVNFGSVSDSYIDFLTVVRNYIGNFFPDSNFIKARATVQ